jgi:uncharacterized membrane protein
VRGGDEVLRRNVATILSGVMLATGGLEVVRLADAGVGGLTATGAAAAVAEPSAEEGTAAWAAARARSTGKAVPVEDEQHERRDVHARPDGTFRATLWSRPVRARTASGWAPIDTTLVARPDGAAAAVATTVPVAFSGGGDEPLVQLGSGSRQVELTWPGTLPKPELAGSTATYREVLPGVDLRMTATADGFGKVFVVRDRASAAAAALRELRLGIRATGATVRADAHGNVTVSDASGEQVFGVGAPLMWDSTADTPRRSLSAMRVDGGDLVLRPDRALLDDPKTVYPVYIDPVFGAGRLGFATVLSGFPNQSYWNDNPRAGLCPTSYDSTCNGIGLARTYFQFDTGFLRGRRILAAGTEFNAFNNWSTSCDARVVQAIGTDRVSSGTTWANQPGSGILLGERNVATGRSGCPGEWLGFPAADIVNWSVEGNRTTTTIMLRAKNEGDQLAWKRFGPNPTLVVSYNSKPHAPTLQRVENKACALAPNEPHVNPFVDNDPQKGKRGPKLLARIADPDGGELRAQFVWYNRGGAEIANTFSAFKTSVGAGVEFTVDIPSAHVGDYRELTVRIRGHDRIDYGPFGPACDVTVDRLAPVKAPDVASPMYPPCRSETDVEPGVDPCPGGGGIGRTGAFTLRPGAGETDRIAGYRFGLTDPPTGYVAAGTGSVATAQVTPPEDGPMDLYVKAVDRAGNEGPRHVYHFWVGPGTPPKGQWRLNGIGTAPVVDDSANNHDGTVNRGPVTWKLGRHGDALAFDGTAAGHVSTTNGPTVQTNRSFAVSAWVKLDRLDGTHRTAVSQDGSVLGGFYLQYDGASRNWKFVMTAADASGAARRAAVSRSPAVAGRWTHLVGVHDAGTRQIQLYVDGVAGTAASHTTAWNATGTVQLGRARIESGHSNFWLGSVDDVRIYDRTLAAEEIHDLAVLPAVEELLLPMEEGTGTTVVDASGNYRIGTVGGAASWTEGVADADGVASRALGLDGRSAAVAMPGPMVRTDSSFTVSARVRPGPVAAEGQTVLSQDGASASGFELGYAAGGEWTFRMALTDTNGVNALNVVAPEGIEAFEGEWTYLAGVYDQAAREIRLYVNTALVGRATVPAAWDAGRWNAAGAFHVGRGTRSGAAAGWFAGAVDDVHAWTGVRTADQIREELPVVNRASVHTGQLARFANVAQHHVVTTGPVPLGSHFEGAFGLPAPEGAEGTVSIHSCRRGQTDYYLARACGDDADLGAIGAFYTAPPAGVAVVPVYRCRTSTGTHFVSSSPACEDQVMEEPLGYTRPYSHLIRYSASNFPYDHSTSTYRMAAWYRPEGSFGALPTTEVAGTTALWSCQDGEDVFSSTEQGCEGSTALRGIGYIWTSDPPDVLSRELFRCRTGKGERFDSLDAACEGQTLDRSLGFVAVAP